MALRRHPEFVGAVHRVLQQIDSSKGNESLKSITDAFAKHMREGWGSFSPLLSYAFAQTQQRIS